MNNEEMPTAVSEQGQWPAPSLILLKSGSQSPPIFMVPGLGGTASDLLQLASQLPVSCPVYGLREQGMDGPNAPLDRIAAMAEFHLGAIRRMQPHGPYLLIGYSLGGLISLEIARRLSKAGERIGLLALLDSYPYRSYLPSMQRMRLLVRLAKLRMASVFRAKAPEGHPAAPALRQVKAAQLRAWHNYRPDFYDGKISFVKATIATFLPDDPLAVWAPMAREIQVRTVPGDHLGMLTIHSESVAQTLAHYLAEACLASSNGD